MPNLPAERFLGWIASYERAWRTPGTEPLHEIFAADATYRAAPFDTPLQGIEEIAAFWEAEREGPAEAFTLTSEIVAADRSTGVARIEVHYGEPSTGTYRDLWIITLGAGDRCTSFEEWPFFPGQPRAATQ
jgi:hypothetical protein